MILYLIRIGLIFILNNQFVENLSCKGEDGKKSVEFMVVYKPPNSAMKGSFGNGYLYKQADYFSYLKFSDIEIGYQSSIIAKTLEEVYSNPNEFHFIMYNDQVPDGVNPTLNSKNKGKSKVLVWKGDEVIWLLHSVPGFPPSFYTGSYGFPVSETKAHNFLCISIRKEDIPTILHQLMKMDIQIYAHNLSSKFSLSYLESLKSLETKPIARLSTQVHNNPVVIISKRKVGIIKKMSSENTLWKMVKEVYKEKKSIWIKTSYPPSQEKLTLYDSNVKLRGGKNPLFKGKCKGIGNISEMEFIPFRTLAYDLDYDIEHIRYDENIPYDLNWKAEQDSSNYAICRKNGCYCHSDKLDDKNDKGMAVCIYSGGLASYYYQEIESIFCKKRKWSLF